MLALGVTAPPPRAIEVAGSSVRVLEAGAGLPVLLLHGNPNTAEVWADLVARLERRYRCVAPDLPGFGDSDVPEDFDASLASMARFVERVLHGAGLAEPVHLVVHDFGGFFGLAFAVRHPEMVRSITVLNTAFFADRRWHFWARVLRTPLLGELAMASMNRRGFAAQLRRAAPGLSGRQIDAIYDRITPGMKRMALRIYRAMDPEAFRGWEEELRDRAARVPVLVLWGDRDPYLPAAFAERFGPAEVHHLPDCGHWPQLEAPGEVAERLLAFLDRAHSSSSPAATSGL